MMTVEDKLCEIIDIKELEIESQQKEIEQLREDKLFYSHQWEAVSKENTKLKEEIRMLKQYAEISKNDKNHRKGLLNKALEEIKQLKNK